MATEAAYWSLQEAKLVPACIVTPLDSLDVSNAVSIISEIEGCHFAVKGQGHAPAAGFANIDSGVTIDMTNLNSVTVNADHTVAKIGAGATWLDVYTFMDNLGLQLAGGRNGAVGVGGLTLGGGISYFAPRVGWTCDTVTNFEVCLLICVPCHKHLGLYFQIVLATGELINANSTSSSDLFRALKGGANNFGVVTCIDFAPFSQGQILDGNLVQDISERDAVFEAFTNIAGANHYDVYASIVTSIVFNATSKQWVTSSAAIYTEATMNPPVFEEIRSIPSITNTWKLTNLSTLAAERAIPQL